jgi:hypothetical protein
MRRLARYLPRALLVAEGVVALSILRDVARVTSYRFFLRDRVDTSRSTATERFLVEESRVVPQIATRDDERLAFMWTNPWPSTLHVGIRAASRSQYEIHWREGDGDTTLARSSVDAAAREIDVAIPGRPGTVEFVSHGPLTWADPRVVGNLRVTGRTMLLVTVAAAWIVVSGLTGIGSAAHRASAWRLVWFKSVAAATGLVVAVLSLEVGLRALGDRAPQPLLAQRHDLGEVRKDPRWAYTARYGRRLRARVSDVSEWRHGDIVQLGFIPADVTDGILHRFPFQTDDEGFRNAATRNRIDVAALGDSFTDAMTIDAVHAWTTVLERQTGLAVQNYGTAGFGPQQELRVLTDFVLRHRPRIVVLAYFAGNDIFDAEVFDEYERSNGRIRPPDPGWPIRPVVSRADTWYVVSAVHAFSRWASNRERAEAQTIEPAPAARPAPQTGSGAVFDRGMFSIPVNGHVLRAALMPPYLNTLSMPAHELESRSGWPLTARAITAMRDASHSIGARFVVMYLPFKSQVYLPFLERTMPRDALRRAFEFYLPNTIVDVDAMTRNRLAQNGLIRRLCERAAVPLLDTTDTLSSAVAAGTNVYFPDESHLNETGHAIVAETLRTFLR